jgi:hypothetical protein
MVFPTSPVVGQVFTSGGRSWVWNGSTWDAPRSDNPPLAIPTGNAIINGGFDVWQRGTGPFTTPANATYTADRWTHFFNGTATVTQDNSLAVTNTGSGIRITATGSSSDNAIFQLIETANTLPLRGSIVTITAWVSGTTGVSARIALAHSTSDNTNLTSTNIAVADSGFVALSSTPQRITVTTTIPANARTLRVGINSSSMVNTNFFAVTGVQLEVGAVATPFKRNAPSIQAELAACQRYYFRWAQTATDPFSNAGLGYADSSGTCLVSIQLPVVMRVPVGSVAEFGGTWQLVGNGSAVTITNFVVLSAPFRNTHTGMTYALVAGGLTFQHVYVLRSAGTNPFIGFSAEL